jgi:serine/threonine protein kinase
VVAFQHAEESLSDNHTNTQFGKYQVIQRISSGGMAEVFKARVDGLGGFQRLFAIKRIHPDHADNQEYVDMLIEEAKIAGLLSHANIVQIVDLGSANDAPFIAMEFVDGPDLSGVIERVKERGSILPIPHAVFVCLELLKALEYAHNRQIMRGGRPVPLDIIHRDVCPANLILSLKGEVKLTDFGIAKASVRSFNTVTGVVKGRIDYLTPEQARGEAVSQRSDLFAVGVLLYEMITGRHPFRQNSQAKTLEAIKKASFVPAVAFNPEVPPSIDRLLGQTLTKNEGDRFASATAMKDALNRFFHEAGYIFSSATLAAYLKGMFPELVPAPMGDDDTADEDGETRPFRRGERPVSAVAGKVNVAEMPTGKSPVIQPKLSLDTSTGHGALTSLETSMSGLFGPIDNEHTIIGTNPKGDDQFGDLDTIIRPIISTHADSPTRVGVTKIGSAPMKLGSATTKARKRPPEKQRIVQGQDTKVRRKPRKSTHPSVRRAQILSLAIGVVMIVSAFIGGLLLGNRAARLTSPDLGEVAIPSDPRLEVHLPVGASLSVDGREVPGTSPQTLSLTPDQSHVVRISRVGHYPVETVIKLQKNDFRLLTIEEGTLHKK